MSKSKYFRKDPTPQPVMVDSTPPEFTKVDDGIAPGQVYEGVKVPDRAINTLGLTPGAVLAPLVIEAPYTQTNDGWWYAFFEGEGCTGITLYVDAEMLKTGRLRK